jgi:uncharacterized UBP type Zn finger protein
MFGLQNFSGSCWVNACLQSLFRIPDVQERYNSGTFENDNKIDEYLCKIWQSDGKEGLSEFFDAVRTATMPAGQGIGDSHELFQYLCDKLPYLDALMRFKIADSIKCKNCDHKSIKEDSVIEFAIATEKRNAKLIECIAEVVKPYDISEWKCEKCNSTGCIKQQLIGSFPKVMMFHLIPLNGWTDYTASLGINKNTYSLASVACYNGSHWWAYGRNLNSDSKWYTLNDRQVTEEGVNKFPLSNRARLLIYYRSEK